MSLFRIMPTNFLVATNPTLQPQDNIFTLAVPDFVAGAAQFQRPGDCFISNGEEGGGGSEYRTTDVANKLFIRTHEEFEMKSFPYEVMHRLSQRFGLGLLKIIFARIQDWSSQQNGNKKGAILTALASMEHLITSEDVLIKAAVLLIKEEEPVLMALPQLVSIVPHYQELENVSTTLNRLSRNSLESFKHVAHLIDSPARIEEVAEIIKLSFNWLLPAIGQSINSVADLREFSSLSREIRKHLKVSWDSAAELSSHCTSLEAMRHYLELQKLGMAPTRYLMHQWSESEDRVATLVHWQAIQASFDRGQFDPGNELHRNLEYTRFRNIVDHEKVRRHIKTHFTFEQYEEIFQRPGNPALEELSERHQFEIACAVHESRLLNGFIETVAARAKELGRPVMVVPNLSYGFVPVAPLMTDLEQQGIEVAIGIKVGSTESHENRQVIDARLFKDYRRRLVQEQPILVVVDGTEHLVAREGAGKGARYPNAYQGYLNQVIAINDALGYSEVDYSAAGKDEVDLERLRETPEFERLVGVFRAFVTAQQVKTYKPYSFELWNMAGMNLLIRGDRSELKRVEPVDPAAINGPAIIFANVGVLDEQIPDAIKDQFPQMEHLPAFWDDTGRIIDFDFGYDSYGVRYLNRLEMELKQAYSDEAAGADSISGFITHLRGSLSLFSGGTSGPYENYTA